MAKTDFPKADNRRVLRPYSASMKQLLKRDSYNVGRRPSEHNVLTMKPMQDDRLVRLPNAFSFADLN
jgi:site-specific DNA-methyltransferase (cytosine-N4-specific)